MNKEEIDLLEIVFTLAIGECAYNDINNIQKLEYKIKTINNLCKKQKEVIDKAINNSQYWIDYYTRLNSDERIELRLQENIDILKEVE